MKKIIHYGLTKSYSGLCSCASDCKHQLLPTGNSCQICIILKFIKHVNYLLINGTQIAIQKLI